MKTKKATRMSLSYFKRSVLTCNSQCISFVWEVMQLKCGTCKSIESKLIQLNICVIGYQALSFFFLIKKSLYEIKNKQFAIFDDDNKVYLFIYLQ